MAVTLCIVSVSSGLRAQIGNPSWWGQWSGPYDLTTAIAENFANEEIAHAIVLPPADGQDSRVLFIARKGTCSNFGQVEGFVWLADRPMVARDIVLASSPADNSEDAFCSGHTLLPDGNVLIAGGLNHVGKCIAGCNQPAQKAFGHLASDSSTRRRILPRGSTTPRLPC